ncbi:MAG: carboxymuconolactone decarboxylase family protein [Anaerolineales bacterium]|nr:carboxymuconolactone decarboxylase family protein [Anaerolineales bacterium]
MTNTSAAAQKAFIDPPARPPFYLRLGLWLSTRMAGRELLPARLLAWYPPAAFSSGVLEALIAHHDGNLAARLLKLVRLQTSFAVACPFCVDMNAVNRAHHEITPAELAALQGRAALEAVPSFSTRERVALEYARLISRAPLAFPPEFVERLKASFTEREIVILASTAAQVNYWARLIQALGIPPMGVSDQCEL